MSEPGADPIDDALARAHQALMAAIIAVRELAEIGVPVGMVPTTCWDAAEQLCMLADSLGRSLEK